MRKNGSAVPVKSVRYNLYISWKAITCKLLSQYVQNQSGSLFEKEWTLMKGGKAYYQTNNDTQKEKQ